MFVHDLLDFAHAFFCSLALGVDAQSLLVVVVRVSVLLLLLVNLSNVDEAIYVFLIVLQSLLVIDQSLIVIAIVLVSTGQVEVALRTRLVQFDGDVVRLNSLLDLPCSVVGVSQVVERRVVLRVKGNRF